MVNVYLFSEWHLVPHVKMNLNLLSFTVHWWQFSPFSALSARPTIQRYQWTVAAPCMVTVTQHCQTCKKNCKWRSQPFILGRYPAGNVLLSFAVLMAGASISKLLLVFKHMGLSVYESRTFFYHQSRFLFPIILKYWETYQASLVTKIKGMKDAVWSGDGRFDSMGHSAKFGAYTLLCSPIMKIVHFELLQVMVIENYWVFHLIATWFSVNIPLSLNASGFPHKISCQV